MTKNNKNEMHKVEDYRNEHGSPSFQYLLSLASENDEESIEKLKAIAEDLNVEYDTDAPSAELIEMIRLAVERNQEGGSDVTT